MVHKRKSIIIFLSGMLSVLFNTAVPAADEILTTEYLASHELISDEESTSDVHKVYNSLPEHIYLKFTGEGNYRADVNFGQWGFPVEGPCIIKNGRITLTISDSTREELDQWLKEENPDRYNKYFLRNGMLIDDSESVKYRRYLKFDDGTKFWDKSTLITEEGLPKKIKAEKVITMGMRKGITKSNVKLREKADTGSKDIRYCKDPEEGPCTNYVPQGEEVSIIARTEKKIKVQKWENYWYYVEFPSTTGAGWIFGEFIELK